MRSCDKVSDSRSDVVVSVDVSEHGPDDKSDRGAVVVTDACTLGISDRITKHGAVIVADCVPNASAISGADSGAGLWGA